MLFKMELLEELKVVHFGFTKKGGANECRTSLFYCVQFYLICASKAIYYDKNSEKKHKPNTALGPPEIVSGNKNMAQYLICYFEKLMNYFVLRKCFSIFHF